MARFSAVETPVFQPAMRLIASVTKSNPATVTTTFDHDYITGEILRFHIPKGYGMKQANKLYAEINVTGSDTFTIKIDTTLFDPLVIPGTVPWYVNAYPSVIPIGENNSILTAATRNVLP